MDRFYNNRGISVNIAATNTGNNRRIALSVRRPLNNFALTTLQKKGNPLLCVWLLGYATILTERGILYMVRAAPITRAVSSRIGAWGSTPRLDSLSDRQSQCDFDFDVVELDYN
jgi:hypothetical protein